MVEKAPINGLPIIAVNKMNAVAMLGISLTKFSELVKSGRMPQPKCIDRRRVWLVSELHVYASALPSLDEEDSWADL